MNLKVKRFGAGAPHRDKPPGPLDLIEPATLAALREPRDGPGLLRLAGHLGLLAVSGTAILTATHWAPWLAAMLVYAITLTFLFTLEHETTHESAFADRRLNRLIAAVTGLLVVVPARWFRYFHFAHHRHTQDVARDPELATPKPANWPAYLFYLTALPYWASMIRTLARLGLGRIDGDYVPAARRPSIVREARLHLALYAAVAMVSFATGNLIAVKLWLIPLIIGQPLLRAYLLAEHGACPRVADMLKNSRTTFAGRAVCFMAWNMPYHTAHHAFPTVPFHRLPELTQMIRDRIAVTATSYPDAHRQIRAGWLGGSKF